MRPQEPSVWAPSSPTTANHRKRFASDAGSGMEFQGALPAVPRAQTPPATLPAESALPYP